jgi:hypothetical protein
MEMHSIKTEILRPDFLNYCLLVHHHSEIISENNSEYLKLKITLDHPKLITLGKFLNYFNTLPDLHLIDWDEAENYDFDQSVYSDFTFISRNKNIIDKFRSLSDFSSYNDYISSLFNLKNEPVSFEFTYAN